MKKQQFKSQEKINFLKQEFKGSSDRAAAIIGGAFLEDYLEIMLQYYFIEDKKHDSMIFEGNGPLSTFSAKISLCYRIGLISKGEYATLETVRAIRNRFAHELSFLNFSDQSIAAKCKNIEYPIEMITPDYEEKIEGIEVIEDIENMSKLDVKIIKANTDQPREVFQETVMVLMNLLNARLTVLNDKKNKAPIEFKSAVEVANEAVKLAQDAVEKQTKIIKLQESLSEKDESHLYSSEDKERDENYLQYLKRIRDSFIGYMKITENSHNKLNIAE